MGKSEKNREMKCQKWCVYESGNGGDWLDTRVRWLRKGDIIRGFENGKVKESPTYKVLDDPHWSSVHKCWDVRMTVWQR